MGGESLHRLAAVPLPLAREAYDGRGRVLENSHSAVPEGAGDGRGRVLEKPPLLKGGGAGEACGGGIHPPTQLSVSTLGDSPHDLGGVGRRIPPPPGGGPPPFGKGGWRRTGPRATNKGAFAVPEGAGEGRGRVLEKPPLLKGGEAGEACRGGIRPPTQLNVSTWGIRPMA